MKFMCIYTLNVEGKTNAGLLSGDPLNIRKKCDVHYIGTELALLAQMNLPFITSTKELCRLAAFLVLQDYSPSN